VSTEIACLLAHETFLLFLFLETFGCRLSSVHTVSGRGSLVAMHRLIRIRLFGRSLDRRSVNGAGQRDESRSFHLDMTVQ
jgi:hypothetical protein